MSCMRNLVPFSACIQLHSIVKSRYNYNACSRREILFRLVVGSVDILAELEIGNEIGQKYLTEYSTAISFRKVGQS